MKKSGGVVLLAMALTVSLSSFQYLKAKSADAVASQKEGINLPEISGAQMLGGRLLVVADDVEDENDDVKKFHMIALIDNPFKRLKKGNVFIQDDEQIYKMALDRLHPNEKPDWETVTDVEDAASSSEREVFLISSHSLTKKCKSQPKRKQLIRLRFNSNGELKQASSLSEKNDLLSRLPPELPKEVTDSVNRRPGMKVDAQYNPGFNIEGLAWAPTGRTKIDPTQGDLLIGLRSPLLKVKSKSEAVVMRLKDANTALDNPNDPYTLVKEAYLDLNGRGIRGMCYDPIKNGYWIIAGLAPDPDKPDPAMPNNWSLYYWDGKGKPQEKLKKGTALPAGKLNNPEAVCVMKRKNGKPSDQLLLIEDADHESKHGGKTRLNPSPYAILSLKDLKK